MLPHRTRIPIHCIASPAATSACHAACWLRVRAAYVDNAGDQRRVSALGGVDTVFASVNRNLTANIENLTLTGSAGLTGSGNTLKQHHHRQ
ncbi:MAG: hypothetical protein IPL62_18055 [Caulobacteraceae bacterium]|nr:hypothetical protein [Caulobacteraceae bacterium]